MVLKEISALLVGPVGQMTYVTHKTDMKKPAAEAPGAYLQQQ